MELRLEQPWPGRELSPASAQPLPGWQKDKHSTLACAHLYDCSSRCSCMADCKLCKQFFIEQHAKVKRVQASRHACMLVCLVLFQPLGICYWTVYHCGMHRTMCLHHRIISSTCVVLASLQELDHGQYFTLSLYFYLGEVVLFQVLVQIYDSIAELCRLDVFLHQQHSDCPARCKRAVLSTFCLAPRNGSGHRRGAQGASAPLAARIPLAASAPLVRGI